MIIISLQQNQGHQQKITTTISRQHNLDTSFPYEDGLSGIKKSYNKMTYCNILRDYDDNMSKYRCFAIGFARLYLVFLVLIQRPHLLQKEWSANLKLFQEKILKRWINLLPAKSSIVGISAPVVNAQQDQV